MVVQSLPLQQPRAQGNGGPGQGGEYQRQPYEPQIIHERNAAARARKEAVYKKGADARRPLTFTFDIGRRCLVRMELCTLSLVHWKALA